MQKPTHHQSPGLRDPQTRHRRRRRPLALGLALALALGLPLERWTTPQARRHPESLLVCSHPGFRSLAPPPAQFGRQVTNREQFLSWWV